MPGTLAALVVVVAAERPTVIQIATDQRRIARRTVALMAAMVVGCSSLPPAPPPERPTTLLWDAATQCAAGIASLRIDRIDEAGNVHGTRLTNDPAQFAADTERFNTCYRQRAATQLASAARAAAPARITESDPGTAGSGPARSRAASVTIQTVGNAVLVPVVLNESQRAWFLLDTGANITVVTPALLQRLGMAVPHGAPKTRARVAGGREMDVPVLRIGSIAVGGAQIDTPQVAIYDVSRSISTHGAVITIDGFLGFDFLGRFTMKLNPHEKTLTLQLEEPAVR